MCVASMVGDDWTRRFPDDYPWVPINPTPPKSTPIIIEDLVSKEEISRLRKEVEELKKLMKAAKIYDEATGQKDCEVDEKVALIKRVAEMVGVDLEDVFN